MMTKLSIAMAALVGIGLLLWVKVLRRGPVEVSSTAPKWLTILAGLGLVTLASAATENCFITCYEAGDGNYTPWETPSATVSPTSTSTSTASCYTPTTTPTQGFEDPITPAPETTPTPESTDEPATATPAATPTADEVVAELQWRLHTLGAFVAAGRLDPTVLELRASSLNPLIRHAENELLRLGDSRANLVERT